MSNKKRIIISGGGTGGHIYPGVAIARALQKLDAEVEIHFVGSKGGLEEKIIPREKFPLHLVSVGKLHKSVGILTRIKTLLTLPLSFFQCIKILFQIKPKAVLGVGGFASGPMLFVASIFGYRTYVWEPNAMPGLTNRLLARVVSECLVVFDEAKNFLKARQMSHAGIPVRFSLSPHMQNQEFQTKALRILVFGGSQGARAINQCVFKLLTEHQDRLKNISWIQQTGPHDFKQAQEVFAKLDSQRFQCFDYLYDMKDRYEACDLVICRAGASTVAEIIACKKPAIFIPLPTAADNHQQKNAEVLVRKNAAQMILQKDLTPQSLLEAIQNIQAQPEVLNQYIQNMQHFKFEESDLDIAKKIINENIVSTNTL